MSHTHLYRAVGSWSGSTAVGYDHYDRAHTLHCPPADAGLELTQRSGVPRRPEPAQPRAAAPRGRGLVPAALVPRRRGSRPDRRARLRGRRRSRHARGRPADAHHRDPAAAPHHRGGGDRPGPGAQARRACAHEHCFIASSLTSEIDIRATVVARAQARRRASGRLRCPGPAPTRPAARRRPPPRSGPRRGALRAGSRAPRR